MLKFSAWDLPQSSESEARWLLIYTLALLMENWTLWVRAEKICPPQREAAAEGEVTEAAGQEAGSKLPCLAAMLWLHGLGCAARLHKQYRWGHRWAVRLSSVKYLKQGHAETSCNGCTRLEQMVDVSGFSFWTHRSRFHQQLQPLEFESATKHIINKHVQIMRVDWGICYSCRRGTWHK